MKRWSERLSGTWTSLLLLMVVSACPRMSEVGSETHFLSNCQARCPAPYSCSCGVCTSGCSSDSECAAERAQASCSAENESEAESACRSEPRVCDVTCRSDFECAALGWDFVCREGRCRTSAEIVDACADDPACADGHLSEASLPQLRVTRSSADTHFKQLALGDLHACALRNDGRVYCWGSNSAGGLGTPIVQVMGSRGRSTAREVPV